MCIIYTMYILQTTVIHDLFLFLQNYSDTEVDENLFTRKLYIQRNVK